jgi:hypothetical protein
VPRAEQQGHVHRDAGGHQLLDGHQPGRRARDLHEHVRPPRLGEQPRAGLDRPGGVVDQERRHLDRHVAVGAGGLLEDRQQQVGGRGEVGERQREDHLLGIGQALGREPRDVVVVLAGRRDRPLEDGGVRRDAGDGELVEVPLQRAAGQQAAPDVVEPDALAGGLQLLRSVHAFLRASRADARSATASGVMPKCSYSSAAGADAPKRSSPTTSSAMRHQLCVAGRLHRDDGQAGRQDVVAVLLALVQEQLEARQRHDARRHPPPGEHVAGGQRDLDLRAGRDQGDVVTRCDDRAAAVDVEQRRVQDGQALPAQHQHAGARVPQGVRPGLHRLVRVGRTQHPQPGHGTQARQVLDGLVGGAVLAQADRVVGEDEHDRQLHDRCHPHGGPDVVAEDEEGRPVDDQPAVRGHGVQGRSHGGLPHPEVQVAPAPGPRRHVGVRREQGLGGRADVGRPADELGHDRGQRVQGLARRHPRRHPRAGLEDGQRRPPPLGQHAGDRALELGDELRVLRAQHLDLGQPRGAGGGPEPDPLGDVRVHRGRHLERRVRPGELLTRLLCGHRPERRAVRLAGVLQRRPVADVGVHHHERRPVGLRDRLRDGPVDRLEVVDVGDPRDVPAVGREARRDVLAEVQRRRALERDAVVVVEDGELAEPEVAGERRRLRGDALHHVAVAGQHPRPVVHQRRRPGG